MSDAPRFEAMPTGPQRGWFARNWLWAVPGGLLVLCLCPVGCCGGVFSGVFAAIKGSEPYQTALGRVQSDPAVIERLGQPIEPSYTASGNVSVQNDTGNADITFDVTGPNGKASVHTTATRAGGVWQTDSLIVTFSDGTQANLLDTGTVEPIPDAGPLDGIESAEGSPVEEEGPSPSVE